MSVHAAAVEKAIKAGTGTLTDAHAPLLELCRTLAGQMDATDQPSTRLTASYLSALKDLGRVLTVKAAAPEPSGTLRTLRSRSGVRRAS